MNSIKRHTNRQKFHAAASAPRGCNRETPGGSPGRALGDCPKVAHSFDTVPFERTYVASPKAGGEKQRFRCTWPVALLAAIGISGCAELKQFDNASRVKSLDRRGPNGVLLPEHLPGVVQVPEAAQCSFGPIYPEGQNCCVMKRYTTGMDVDTAYARAVQEYGLGPKPNMAEGAGYSHYKGHLFQIDPGAMYRMTGEVVPRSDVKLFRGLWIGLVIARASPTSTDVEPVYCEVRGRQMQDQLGWHLAVQKSIWRTLPPLSTQPIEP